MIEDQYALVGANTSESLTNTIGTLVVDIATRGIVAEIDRSGQPNSVKISPDGKYVAVAIAIGNERSDDPCVGGTADGTEVDEEVCAGVGGVLGGCSGTTGPRCASWRASGWTGCSSTSPRCTEFTARLAGADPILRLAHRTTEAMVSIRIQRGDHVRQYSIRSTEHAGWEVRLEEDRRLTRHVRYHDWHRVERALALFRREVAHLTAQGWEIQANANGAPAAP